MLKERTPYFGFALEKASGELVLSRVSLEDHITASLRSIILTRKEERGLSPEVGSGLSEKLYRPLTGTLRREIETDIRAAIERCEPRIDLQQITVSNQGENKSHLSVQLNYRVKESQKTGRFQLAINP